MRSKHTDLRLLCVFLQLRLDVVQVHGVEVFRVLAVSFMAKHLDLILTVFAFGVLSSRIGCHTNCPTQRDRLIFPVFDLRMAVLMSRLPLAHETETRCVIVPSDRCNGRRWQGKEGAKKNDRFVKRHSNAVFGSICGGTFIKTMTPFEF